MGKNKDNPKLTMKIPEQHPWAMFESTHIELEQLFTFLTEFKSKNPVTEAHSSTPSPPPPLKRNRFKYLSITLYSNLITL